MALPYLFGFWAHPHQLPPEKAANGDDWRCWLVLGGRGAGKTRAGAEWVRSQVEGPLPKDPGRRRRLALVGETLDQAREVMVFGESGILAVSPPDRRPDWVATRRMLVWPNGATAQLFSAHEPESLRGPQFDAAWIDEYGCPAVDRGANQPNVFYDPKSSESAFPYYSSGRRDDVMQMQYARALLSYWGKSSNNPVSVEYGGPMVDMDHAHAWCWDSRPFPAFPNRSDLWTDAPNYMRGHWLTGRGGARSLAGLVAEVCRNAGVTEFDVSELYGMVRGYQVDGTDPGRSALQPLMLAFGFDAFEREGKLVFRSRGGSVSGEVDPEQVVAGEDGDIEMIRAPEAEVSGRVRLAYVDAEGDYEIRSAEAIFPDQETHRVDRSELPLALIGVEGRGITERWLSEARVARDRVRLTLPPSQLDIGTGDVLELEGSQYRVDRVELTESQQVEAVRIEDEVYEPSDAIEEPTRNRRFVPPLPVFPLFLDLPLLKGTEVPHAPHVAVSARPWPGRAAVFSSEIDDDYDLNLLLRQPAALGLSKSSLAAGPVGRFDRGSTLRVRLTQGELSSVGELSLLNGANAAAIGDGSSGNWEVIQFQTATLVAPRTWDLTDLLRGQAGSDALMPAAWPMGSNFVLLNSAVKQIALDQSARRLSRHYRIGPAGRGYDDPSFVHLEQAFDGNGLRPYSPVHLAERRVGGDRSYDWIRRTRVDGDSWESTEVPLGEAEERYRVRVTQAGTVLREVEVSGPTWTYTAAEVAADAVTGAAEVRVAQLSGSYGAGPEGILAVTF